MYQERKNNWMRKLANGREMYLLPVGDVGTAVFMSEMLQQMKSYLPNVDAICSAKAQVDGHTMDQKAATPPAMMPVASNVSCSLTAWPNLHKLQAQLQGQDPGNQEPRKTSSCRVNLNINGDGFTSIFVYP